jgi:hypothetical protein
MPDYTIRDPKTGRTVTLRGDSPPTAGELEVIFAKVNTEQTPAPKPQAPAPAQPQQGMLSRAVNFGLDAVVGGVKGAANTVVGLGELAHQYVPGVGRVTDALYGGSQAGAYDAARTNLQPTNTAQKVGFGLEQVGEFFVPAAKVAKIKTGSRVLRAGMDAVTAAPLALAQGASNVEAGVTGALSAAVPGASAAIRGTRNALRTGAEKNVAQALGATKEWAKSDAAKLAPAMLKNGVGGSRKAMLERASAEVDAVGQKIGAEIRRVASAGGTVEGPAISNIILSAKNPLMVTNARGAMVPIPGTESVIKKLDDLSVFVDSLGTNIPFDKAAQIKTTLDKIVSKAGLFGAKAMSSATDNASVWATREASGGFRKLMAEGSATLDDLNKEYAFWKGLKNVLKETEKRTQAQGGGLVAGITGAAGVTGGLASGGDAGDKIQNAVLGGLAGRQLIKVMQSPWFRTKAAGPLKNKLADALANGRVNDALEVLARMTATLPTTGRLSPVPAR